MLRLDCCARIHRGQASELEALCVRVGLEGMRLVALLVLRVLLREGGGT